MWGFGAVQMPRLSWLLLMPQLMDLLILSKVTRRCMCNVNERLIFLLFVISGAQEDHWSTIKPSVHRLNEVDIAVRTMNSILY